VSKTNGKLSNMIAIPLPRLTSVEHEALARLFIITARPFQE